MILYVVVKKNCKKKTLKGARFELARSTDQQITLVKKDLNPHLKSVTLDQLGQPSKFDVNSKVHKNQKGKTELRNEIEKCKETKASKYKR